MNKRVLLLSLALVFLLQGGFSHHPRSRTLLQGQDRSLSHKLLGRRADGCIRQAHRSLLSQACCR